MSVYMVYTKTVKLPVYVLYQCQACKQAVIINGSYSLSSSYSDEGTFTRKGVAKREQKTDDYLQAEAERETRYLKDNTKSITKEYRRVNCTCPYCWHSGLSKHDKETVKQMKNRLTWITAAVIFVVLLILSIVSVGVSIGSIILCTFIITGIVSIFGEGILDLIENCRMKKVYREATPMISANKTLLLKRGTISPVYKNVDRKHVADMPDILEIVTANNT